MIPDHIVALTVSSEKPGSIIVTTECPLCLKRQDIVVIEGEFKAYAQRQKHIQHAMPSLSPIQREAMLTGTCDACWDAMFQDDDEEEDVDVP